MKTSECVVCGGSIEWHWEEAFFKLGFAHDSGHAESLNVANALLEAGYELPVQPESQLSILITSIKKGGIEQIPEHINVGYENPRLYLPEEILQLLDQKFPAETPSDLLEFLAILKSL